MARLLLILVLSLILTQVNSQFNERYLTPFTAGKTSTTTRSISQVSLSRKFSPAKPLPVNHKVGNCGNPTVSKQCGGVNPCTGIRGEFMVTSSGCALCTQASVVQGGGRVCCTSVATSCGLSMVDNGMYLIDFVLGFLFVVGLRAL